MTRGLKVRLRVGSNLGLVGAETDWTEPDRFGPTRYFDSECGPLLDTPPYFYHLLPPQRPLHDAPRVRGHQFQLPDCIYNFTNSPSL